MCHKILVQNRIFKHSSGKNEHIQIKTGTLSKFYEKSIIPRKPIRLLTQLGHYWWKNFKLVLLENYVKRLTTIDYPQYRMGLFFADVLILIDHITGKKITAKPDKNQIIINF